MATETLRLRSPGELLAVVPYLLGFEPTNSIMCICLQDSRIGLTQRLDLPPAGQGEDAVRLLMPSLLREHPDQVLVLAYEEVPNVSAETVDHLTSALGAASIPIHDRLLVRDGRWRSLDCHERKCCPVEGQLVPTPADVPELAAEFVGHELSPHASRDALVDQLNVRPDHACDRDFAGAEALDDETRLAAWPQILDAGDSPAEVTPAMAAIAAATLRDVHVRDGLVAWLTPGTLDAAQLPSRVRSFISSIDRDWDAEEADTGAIVAMNRIQARLIRLCTLLPDEHAAPALTVLACFTWWRGNGTLTRAALNRALRCQPDYRLALLLERMVDLAIRPRMHR
ncbi:DUF4192 domain-containing protein [Pedococcus sp. 2YAF34]|uniref:DUF4192 domain-containing protein n=1 Tax=Pedococcus sp. 2YAF34 TaxID=3233032 RepID=UPI003F94EB2F